MTIVVTGANGQFGSSVVRHLRDRLPDESVVASVRDPSKATGLGVEVRHGDFDEPATLPRAFAGADKLLMVSTDGFDYPRKVRHHIAAVEAAVEAGVRHIVYTSVTAADTTGVVLARAHRPTELTIEASGVPYTFLRNNTYFENDTATVMMALATGIIATSTRGGRFAPAARDDYARAAAVVLGTDGHEGAVYELGSPTTYSYADWAEEISSASGRHVTHVEVSDEQAMAAMQGAGLPDGVVELFVSFYGSVARGEFDVPSQDLTRLLEREPLSLRELVSAAVSSAASASR